MMKDMCNLHNAAWALVIVGALNWLLVGAFQYNLVMSLLGQWPMAERLVYVLVGVAGLLMLGGKKCCMGKMNGSPSAMPKA